MKERLKPGKLLYLIMAIVVLADQLSKLWIRLHMPVGDSIQVWDGILEFARYENSGAAFSLFAGYGRWFLPAAVIFVGAVFYFHRKGSFRSALEQAAAGCVAGGAAGNGIDRLLFGKVTDFIHFQSGNGILNLADYAINIGVILFVVHMLLSSRQSLKKKMEGIAESEHE